MSDFYSIGDLEQRVMRTFAASVSGSLHTFHPQPSLITHRLIMEFQEFTFKLLSAIIYSKGDQKETSYVLYTKVVASHQILISIEFEWIS